MKNTLIVAFFGCAIMVSNFFTTKAAVSPIIVILNKKIIDKEIEKRLLMKELNYMTHKNKNTIDSLKNQ